MKGNLTVHMTPGMSLVVEAPSSERLLGFGDFPKTTTLYKDENTSVELRETRGFELEDEDVGSIRIPKSSPYKDRLAIIYDHKQPLPNKIFFHGRTGRKAVVSIVSVSIHDHSSIVQGGPAYGTYFRDKSGD